MRQNIVPIVEEYLEERRNSQTFSEAQYKQKLLELHIPEDKADDILLRMDDEWTREKLLRHSLKRVQTSLTVSYSIAILGLIMTVLSFFDVYYGGNVYFLFYGAIAVGIIGAIRSRSIISGIRHELQYRKYEWKNWV